MKPSPGQIHRNYETGEHVLVLRVSQAWSDRAGNEHFSWMVYSQDGMTEVYSQDLLEETENVDETG